MKRFATLLALILVSACGVREQDPADPQQQVAGSATAEFDDAVTPAAKTTNDESARPRCRTRCGNKICPIGMPCYVRCCSYSGEACSGGNIHGSCWNADANKHGLCGAVRNC